MTDDVPPPRSSPATATGGCALGCGSVFVVVGIVFLCLLGFVRHLKPSTSMVLLFVGGPAFLQGHVFAIIALQSNSEDARQNGKRALWVMWSGLVVLGLIYLWLFSPDSAVAK